MFRVCFCFQLHVTFLTLQILGSVSEVRLFNFSSSIFFSSPLIWRLWPSSDFAESYLAGWGMLAPEKLFLQGTYKPIVRFIDCFYPLWSLRTSISPPLENWLKQKLFSPLTKKNSHFVSSFRYNGSISHSNFHRKLFSFCD